MLLGNYYTIALFQVIGVMHLYQSTFFVELDFQTWFRSQSVSQTLFHPVLEIVLNLFVTLAMSSLHVIILL